MRSGPVRLLSRNRFTKDHFNKNGFVLVRFLLASTKRQPASLQNPTTLIRSPVTPTTLSSDQRLADTIGKSTLFGIVASGAQIGTRLVTVPVVIHHLGLGGYGIWSIIMVTAAYMRFGSAGIKSAFQKYVAEATGNGDFQTANKLLSTGSISMLLLSVAGLVPAVLLAPKLARASGVPAEFLSAAASSITVLAAIYVVSNFGSAFEAIVMGGHRVDLTRKYSTVLTVCEAAVIIAMLHFGYGLLAMTLIMGTSELIYIFLCYQASHHILPDMHISVSNFTREVFPELIRFAGSYQLVNVLELLYGSILPIVILKFFGAEAAGVLAVTARVVASALIAQDALVLPILSGGTMVFASGSTEQMRLFLAKSFKATLAAALLPLSFVAAFGTVMIFAWTGEADPRFQTTLWLIALASLLRAVSLLQLILYRASGRALLDNIRQVLRIAAILVVAVLGRRIGFNGVLAGMAVAEFVGVVFMFFAMAATFRAFSARIVARDAVRVSLASALIIGAGVIAGMVPIPWAMTERLAATVKLGEIAMGCLIVAWPVLVFTRSISTAEKRTVLAMIPHRRVALATSK
jgi:O-antigen/teichoic acid export membrane protein